uniref:Uncharacterized protein n=1 Tax=Pipistrellus kuhlii TaxID=59472 RepID=A0A7J8B268_PIPKU|nr:hypothetical protein mPipKuh1_007767 [Pipistrellus kuhlii]
MMCLGVVLFGFLLFGILCASWTCKSISFTRLGNFSVTISPSIISISCSFSSSGTPIILMLVRLKLSQRFLTLSSTFWNLLSSCFCGGVSSGSVFQIFDLILVIFHSVFRTLYNIFYFRQCILYF